LVATYNRLSTTTPTCVCYLASIFRFDWELSFFELMNQTFDTQLVCSIFSRIVFPLLTIFIRYRCTKKVIFEFISSLVEPHPQLHQPRPHNCINNFEYSEIAFVLTLFLICFCLVVCSVRSLSFNVMLLMV
jgi:hypothetical protein